METIASDSVSSLQRMKLKVIIAGQQMMPGHGGGTSNRVCTVQSVQAAQLAEELQHAKACSDLQKAVVKSSRRNAAHTLEPRTRTAGMCQHMCHALNGWLLKW